MQPYLRHGFSNLTTIMGRCNEALLWFFFDTVLTVDTPRRMFGLCVRFVGIAWGLCGVDNEAITKREERTNPQQCGLRAHLRSV